MEFLSIVTSLDGVLGLLGTGGTLALFFKLLRPHISYRVYCPSPTSREIWVKNFEPVDLKDEFCVNVSFLPGLVGVKVLAGAWATGTGVTVQSLDGQRVTSAKIRVAGLPAEGVFCIRLLTYQASSNAMPVLEVDPHSKLRPRRFKPIPQWGVLEFLRGKFFWWLFGAALPPFLYFSVARSSLTPTVCGVRALDPGGWYVDLCVALLLVLLSAGTFWAAAGVSGKELACPYVGDVEEDGDTWVDPRANRKD